MKQQIIDDLISLSDEIDMSEYREDWKEKSQELITKITKEVKENI